MDREQAQDLFSAYRDGELSTEQVRALEEFLAGDEATRQDYEVFCRTVDSLSRLREEPAPDNFVEKLMQRIQREVGARAPDASRGSADLLVGRPAPSSAPLQARLNDVMRPAGGLSFIAADPKRFGSAQKKLEPSEPLGVEYTVREVREDKMSASKGKKGTKKNADLDAMFSVPAVPDGVQAGELGAISGPAAIETGASVTEVVTMWGNTHMGVTHFPHAGTFKAGGGGMWAGLTDLTRKIIHTKAVEEKTSFFLGEDPESDVWVAPDLLGGRNKVSLLDTNERGSTINLIPGMTGTVSLLDGTRMDLQTAAGGANVYGLPIGGRAVLRLGNFTFLVNSVVPGRQPKLVSKSDRSTLAFTAFAFVAHAAFLFIVFFVPPDPWGLSVEDLLAEDDRFVDYELLAMEMLEQDVEVEDLNKQDNQDQGGSGKRHVGEEGQMGRPDAQKNDNRYAIKGPADNPDPHMARERAKEYAANSGILSALQSNAPTSPFGQDSALGVDPENALGLLMGNQIGDSFGYGGLGLRGTGRGGGGNGLGTIGLGNLGTIGHGGGGGSGSGYGRGAGGLRGHRAAAPSIRTGTAEVRGSLSKEVIRRYIRRSINQIRFCYEQQLARRPDLAGRVSIRFVISPSGAVTSSQSAGSTLGEPTVETCVARAVQRIAFPQPEGGGVVIVTYPFMFQSAEGGDGGGE
jgi:TonB family protein